MRIEKSNLSCRVLSGEPRLEDYFNQHHPPTEAPPAPPDPPHSQYDRRGHDNGRKVRADMAIRLQDHITTMVLDFTITDPTSRANIPGYNKVGHAAANAKMVKLRNEYKDWMVSGNNQVTNNFKIIAFETFCVGIPEDIKSVFSHLIHPVEDPIQVMRLVHQQLSVALHVVRAKAFHCIVNQKLVNAGSNGGG